MRAALREADGDAAGSASARGSVGRPASRGSPSPPPPRGPREGLALRDAAAAVALPPTPADPGLEPPAPPPPAAPAAPPEEAAAAAAAAAAAPAPSAEPWECGDCFMENEGTATQCTVCGSAPP
eukprot:TRINITY_DN11685_c1_g2_i3.p5 TRINITY_DN11685_c1_g2~~TRINITY_DN11685_c1_g2_i3.p5  ORF type:complete len:124 (+),score=28.89 TRINITY_DN11685_c1_g2_i3:135-506(+)